MPDFAGPMLRRWELGNALRRIREDRHMTIAEVTTAMRERYGSSFSTTKLSRLETAKRGAIPRDVHDLCNLYGLPDHERSHLVDLAVSTRESDKLHPEDAPSGYRWYIELERIAKTLQEYASNFIPGLLQTAEYATAVEQLQYLVPDYYKSRIALSDVSENTEDRVQLRLSRQAVLTRADPLELHVILDESVLRRRIPKPGVMRRQLQRLLDASSKPNLNIQILPFEIGPYPGSECSYWSILNFPESGQQPPRTVYTETANGGQTSDRETDIIHFTGVFKVLTQMALDPEQSRNLIKQNISQLPT